LVVLTAPGEIVEQCWLAIPKIHHGVRIDRFVTMPDHFHGLIWLDHPIHPLDHILGGFKSATTRKVNQLWGTSGPTLWHRSYHESIIRDQRDLHAVRRYIERNPERWVE
jgi:REP element-mobilizing transposase RayT